MLMSNKKFRRSTYLYTTPKDVPADFMPDKKADFRLSRWCLKKLTQEENLNISNHLHMEESREKLVSVTHTKELAAGALCTNPEVKSVGIDIEWSDRRMREGSFKYFVTCESELEIHSPLEIWCIKEAAFKAYSPFHDENKKILVLTDFRIINEGQLEGPDGSTLSYGIEKKRIEDKEFLLVLSEY